MKKSGDPIPDLTRILIDIKSNDKKAGDKLLPLVYDELRKLAALKLSQERTGQTLQPTALVHEAFLKLVGPIDEKRQWQGRQHFYAAAAEAMRRILVDNARRKKRAKHGKGQAPIPLDDVASPTPPSMIDILALDEALTKLAAEDPQKAEIVKLRYFTGLSLEEAAEHVGVSRATASRYWTYARAWLLSEMSCDE